MISSPSISRPGWNLTTMLLVNTRCGSWEQIDEVNILFSESEVGQRTTYLFRTTSFQWQIQSIAQFAFAQYLACTVSIEIGVGQTEERFIEFHFNLFVWRMKIKNQHELSARKQQQTNMNEPKVTNIIHKAPTWQCVRVNEWVSDCSCLSHQASNRNNRMYRGCVFDYGHWMQNNMNAPNTNYEFNRVVDLRVAKTDFNSLRTCESLSLSLIIFIRIFQTIKWKNWT